MKLYSNGLIGSVATVAALVANVELTEKFNIAYPYIYWGWTSCLRFDFTINDNLCLATLGG